MGTKVKNQEPHDWATDIIANPPDPMTVVEASMYLGISDRMVRNALGRGELKADRKGMKLQIPFSAVVAFKSTMVVGGGQ